MTYKFKGKTLTDDRYYRPASEDEARAKFAYFREAESRINGGPTPLLEHSGCGTDRGYMAHLRRKEDRCQPCKAAHAAAESTRYHRRKLMRKPSACGTNRGYMRHFALKEERCAPCKAAHTQVELERQRKAKNEC